MSTYFLHLTGCRQRFLMEVDAPSPGNLAHRLSIVRYKVFRIVGVAEERTSQGAAISVERIGMIVEPE